MAINNEPTIARSDRFTRTISYLPFAVRASDFADSIVTQIVFDLFSRKPFANERARRVLRCDLDLLEARPFAASTGHCGLHDARRWLGSRQ